MEQFGKYVGVQGVLAFILVAAYSVAPFLHVTLPDEYKTFMVLILGYYLGKNGTTLLAAVTGRVKGSAKTVATVKTVTSPSTDSMVPPEPVAPVPPEHP